MLCSTARYFFPPLLVLLSKHTPFRASARDPRRYASVPAGVPKEARSQAAPCCIPSQTRAKDNEISIAFKRSSQI
uniref:Putative secreted protein n=1 Tax=Anopheles darlingi TaxID=43151 RepID=A0A2M4DKQ0_ANODA